MPHLSEYRALLRNAILHDDIVRRNAITRYKEQSVLVDIEEVPHFSGRNFVELALRVDVDECGRRHCDDDVLKGMGGCVVV
jgi:hypothetical protein